MGLADHLRVAGPAPDPLVQEARFGGTESGQALNRAIVALSRTARFLRYEAHNEAVTGSIDDLRNKI